MRKAFIGLSTPVGFDYRNKASKAPADTHSSPNPVLDSPFGLLLLFDELIFLSRSLCPENMRALPYVSFLDEDDGFPKVTEAEIEAVWKAARNALEKRTGNALSFQDSLENAGVIHAMGIDNHSHGLRIGPIKCQANADPYNLAIDAYICSRQNDPTIELVTNSLLQPCLEPEGNSASQSLLTLILENIPNYLTPQGPYHPVIEEVRANPYLSEFRKWVTQQRGLASPGEVREVKTEVENVLQDAQEKLFLKHCDPSRHYRSVGKAMLGDAIGILFPATGTVTALIEAGAEALNPQAMRWQGFLVRPGEVPVSRSETRHNLSVNRTVRKLACGFPPRFALRPPVASNVMRPEETLMRDPPFSWNRLQKLPEHGKGLRSLIADGCASFLIAAGSTVLSGVGTPSTP